MKDFEVKIISIDVVAKDTKKLILTKPKNFNFKAGQFLLIKFTKKLMRAYSIASTPDAESIELIIRIITGGEGSTIIDSAKIGDKFKITQPMGHFTLSENKEAELFFLATGTGIAPIKSMIKTETQSKIPRKITLYYGGKNEEDLAYLDEIRNWLENLTVKLGLSRQTEIKTNLPAENCRITKFLEEESFSKFAEFYICGNKDMVKGTKQLLLSKGVQKENIFFERFS